MCISWLTCLAVTGLLLVGFRIAFRGSESWLKDIGISVQPRAVPEGVNLVPLERVEVLHESVGDEHFLVRPEVAYVFFRKPVYGTDIDQFKYPVNLNLIVGNQKKPVCLQVLVLLSGISRLMRKVFPPFDSYSSEIHSVNYGGRSTNVFYGPAHSSRKVRIGYSEAVWKIGNDSNPRAFTTDESIRARFRGFSADQGSVSMERSGGSGIVQRIYLRFRVLYQCSSLLSRRLHLRELPIHVSSLNVHRTQLSAHYGALMFHPSDGATQNPYLESTDDNQHDVQDRGRPISPHRSHGDFWKLADNEWLFYICGIIGSILLIAGGMCCFSSRRTAAAVLLLATGLLLDVITCSCAMLDCLPWRGCL